MQYVMQIFEDEKHDEFRVIDRNGEPWFILSDVCRSLGIKNPSGAAARLDEDEKMTLDLTEGHSGVRGGARRMNVINESGLYSVILRSDKPEAKRFKKWVTAEVLPSIRKTGGYNGKVPAFIRRYNENWDRVETGHFSVISELVIRVWGRLEMAGYIMADRAKNGKELRPDVSVGRGFSDWLQENHPSLSTGSTKRQNGKVGRASIPTPLFIYSGHMLTRFGFLRTRKPTLNNAIRRRYPICRSYSRRLRSQNKA